MFQADILSSSVNQDILTGKTRDCNRVLINATLNQGSLHYYWVSAANQFGEVIQVALVADCKGRQWSGGFRVLFTTSGNAVLPFNSHGLCKQISSFICVFPSNQTRSPAFLQLKKLWEEHHQCCLFKKIIQRCWTHGGNGRCSRCNCSIEFDSSTTVCWQ